MSVRLWQDWHAMVGCFIRVPMGPFPGARQTVPEEGMSAAYARGLP